MLDNIPQELKDRNQWIVWKREQLDDKETKVPYQAKSPDHKASSTNPEHWCDFTTARFMFESGGNNIAGIGFVFSANDPYIGIDFDHCYNLRDKIALPSVASDIYDLDSYTEFSQSGKGFHVIVRGQNPLPDGKGQKKGNFELYSQGRYFAMTGDTTTEFSKIIRDVPKDVLSRFSLKYFFNEDIKNQQTRSCQQIDYRTRLFLGDSNIISLAERAENGIKFKRLWMGNTSGYASASEADLALCAIFAFYTKDPMQLQRLLTSSGLMRKKLDRPDYILSTIEKSLRGVNQQYDPHALAASRYEAKQTLITNTDVFKEARPKPILGDIIDQ